MSGWVRQLHRWLSVAFTLMVLANFVAVGVKLREDLAMGLGMATLIPLFLLLFSGLYLFALPYIAKAQNA